MPFDLPAEQPHGFWVDLFVPTDAPAGPYQGTYRVTAEGKPAVELPVTVTVWDFALPRVSTMKTALGSPAERLRGYYRQRSKQGKEQPPGDWAAVNAQCIEDYEYLAILERAGLADAAQELVLPLAASWRQWEPNAAKYEEARSKLAAMIVSTKQ